MANGSAMNTLKKWFRWLLTFVCVGYVVYFLYVHRQDFGRLSDVNGWFIVALVLLSVLVLAVDSERCRQVLKQCSDKAIAASHWFRLFVLGRFLNMVAPQLGNVFRGVSAKRAFGMTYAQYISGFACFAWLDTLLNLALALVLILAYGRNTALGGIPLWAAVGGILFLLGTGPLVAYRIVGRMNFSGPKKAWLHKQLKTVLQDATESFSDLGYVVRFALLGAVVFGLSVGLTMVGFRSIGQPVGLVPAALFCSVLKLAILVNITPGNLGVRELAYGALGGALGVGSAEAMMASVIIRLVSTIVVIVLGMLLGGLSVLRKKTDLEKTDKTV